MLLHFVLSANAYSVATLPLYALTPLPPGKGGRKATEVGLQLLEYNVKY